MSRLNFLLEPLDQPIRLGQSIVSSSFVHRGVTPPPECSQFCVELMVVEYSWVQHDDHCPSATATHAALSQRETVSIMTTIHSFAPIVSENAHTLILGSMPGVASLTAQAYYAHPRNAFWQIIGELFEAGPNLDYEDRVAALRRHGIAVWDVMKLCTRTGSLDSAIVESSIEINDITALLESHPSINRIFFNGAKAEASYRRYAPTTARTAEVTMALLPSTSPAHASMNFETKLAAWAVVGR